MIEPPDILKSALFSIVLGVVLSPFLIYWLEREPPAAREYPTLAELLRPRMSWPCWVELLEPHQTYLVEHDNPLGRVVLQPGIFLHAKSLEDDGMLVVRWSDLDVRVPFEKTSFWEQVITPDSIFAQFRPPRKLQPLPPDL